MATFGTQVGHRQQGGPQGVHQGRGEGQSQGQKSLSKKFEKKLIFLELLETNKYAIKF